MALDSASNLINMTAVFTNDSDTVHDACFSFMKKKTSNIQAHETFEQPFFFFTDLPKLEEADNIQIHANSAVGRLAFMAKAKFRQDCTTFSIHAQLFRRADNGCVKFNTLAFLKK